MYYITIVQPTRCTYYLKLFILVKRSKCFGRSFLPSSGAQNCVYSKGICQTAAATCYEITWIDKLIEGADIVSSIEAQRIQYLGHIQRMDQARPTRKLLDWRPMGNRPVGRPRQRWQEDVMEDLKKLKVKNWN